MLSIGVHQILYSVAVSSFLVPKMHPAPRGPAARLRFLKPQPSRGAAGAVRDPQPRSLAFSFEPPPEQMPFQSSKAPRAGKTTASLAAASPGAQRSAGSSAERVKGTGSAEPLGVASLASAGHRRRCGAGWARASMAAAGGGGSGAAPREDGMPGAGEEEDGEENILYDLLVNTEWPPETEVQVRVVAARPGCGDRPRRRGAGCAPGARDGP